MHVYDLTQPISSDMPVYPGTEGPRIENRNTIQKDGFAEKLLSMYSHTGTHIDAPAHMLPGAPTLDRLDVGTFLGRCRVFDVSRVPGGLFGVEDVGGFEALESIGGSSGIDFALFRTGWSAYWGSDRYFSGFPVPTGELATLLAARKLKGFGVDAISADPVDTLDFPNHMVFFRAGMIIIENLRGLDVLIGENGRLGGVVHAPRNFLFSCMPLKIAEADGSPVRAFAVELESAPGPAQAKEPAPVPAKTKEPAPGPA